MAAFRPSCRVLLTIRLEEFGDTAALKATLERKPPEGGTVGSGTTGSESRDGSRTAQDQNMQARRQLNDNRGKLSAPEYDRQRADLDKQRSGLQRNAGGTGEAQRSPLGLEQNPNDERTVVFSIQPLEVKVERNEIKDAGRCEVVFDFRDIPVDPRVIRSCGVVVDIGVVEAGDFARGILKGEQNPDGSLASEVPHEPGSEYKFNSTTRFIGYADEWATEWGDDGDTIRLQCRDLSALLRDQRLPEDAHIDQNIPIRDGVQQLVDRFVSSRGIQVVYGSPTNADDPLAVLVPDIEQPIPAKNFPRTKLSKDGKSKAKKRGGHDQSVWEHIVETTQELALVPIWRGFTLFLSQPRALFASFSGARRMVWGRNIRSLQFARDFTGAKNKTIEIRSYDTTIGFTRWARYPVLDGEPTSGILGKEGSPQPVVTRPSKVTPSGTAEDPIATYFIRSVTDQKILEDIARNRYEEIARQEVEGALETDDIESFDSQTEADLLALWPGEPVTIEIAPPTQVAPSGAETAKPSNTTSNLQELTKQSVAERAAYLQSLGMSAENAQRLAAAQEGIRLVSTFRAGHVNIDWTAEDGISLDFDFHNFIVARDAPDESEQQPAPVTLSEGAARA